MTTEPSPAPEPAIVVRDLVKTYAGGRVVAVSHLDMDVPAGGVHAFLGPNGSGKTTTLRMLLGLIKPDSGTMRVLGRPVPERLPEIIDQVGAIVEQPRFFSTMSATSNLGVLARGLALPRRRVDEVIEQVGLSARARDDVRTYSLGMRQRLAIAATLLKDPQILIFDEPTNGLDPAGIHEVRTTMRALADEGRTVVVSSHILAEVQAIADTVTIIARGRVVRAGRVAEILSGAGRVRVTVAPVEEAARVLTASGYLVGLDGSDTITVGLPDGVVDPAAVARVLGTADLWPSALARAQESLEDVFLQLTAHEHLTATQGQGLMPRRLMNGGAA